MGARAPRRQAGGERLSHETPVDRLRRWEEFGALVRVRHLSDERAVVDLCSCTGQPEERVETGDEALIAYLRERGPM
jgi:hypothetical protein